MVVADPASQDAAAASGTLWWLRSACFFQVFAFGVAWPFEGVWMRQQGLGESLIGAVVSLSTAVLLLAGLGWGVVADRTGRPDRIVLLGCVGVAASLAWLTLCSGPLDFALYAIGRGLSMPMIGNLMPMLAISALGTAAQGRGYARYRIFGSFGYICSTL
ncbi:MAG: MFS transporter, partial [bacterium]|nr:MFS transporter [bacterium]